MLSALLASCRSRLLPAPLPVGTSVWARWLSTNAKGFIPLRFRTVPMKPGQMPRSEKITTEHVGHSFLVHSGRDWKRVRVTMQMLDHKFGEFVLTRKRPPPPKMSTGRQQKKR